MKWKKLGVVYGHSFEDPLAKTHAMLPKPLAMDKRILRVYSSIVKTGGTSLHAVQRQQLWRERFWRRVP